MTLSSKKCPTQLKLDRKKCLRVLGRVQTLSEPNVSNHENSGMNTSTLIQRTSLTTISGLKILEAVSKETRTRDLNGGLTLISLLGKFFFTLRLMVKTERKINIVNISRMDEPNPKPEDLYKRPEELFNHPKPPPNYGESPVQKAKSKKRQRFQSSLGTTRGKKPWQVNLDNTKKILMMIHKSKALANMSDTITDSPVAREVETKETASNPSLDR